MDRAARRRREDVGMPLHLCPFVAQWIEQLRPKEKMGVRFPPRGPLVRGDPYGNFSCDNINK
jgi:hypothetical protein